MASAFPAAVNSGTEAEAAHRYPGAPALGSYQQVEAAIGVRHLLTDHLPTPARDIVVLGIKLRFVDRHILNVVYVAAVHAHPPPLVLAVKNPAHTLLPTWADNSVVELAITESGVAGRPGAIVDINPEV